MKGGGTVHYHLWGRFPFAQFSLQESDLIFPLHSFFVVSRGWG